MITKKFRDVLWAIAYQIGNDPTKNDFLVNQAASVVSYINQFVDRVWPSADFPEWTLIGEFTPVNHIVTYEQRLTNHFSNNPLTPLLGRIFKAYLADPRLTDAPCETRFTLQDTGVHVGFEHGDRVWLKFQKPPPVFSSDQWNPDYEYSKGEVIYVPSAGECFYSLLNGNLGNDPTFSFTHPPPPPVVRTQERTPDNPGNKAQTKIIEVTLAPANPVGAGIPPNPLPNLSQIYIPVLDSSGLITSATFTATGSDSLADAITSLVADLIADVALSTFTITGDTNAFKIRFEDASDFQLDTGAGYPFYVPSGGPIYRLLTTQIQPYLPASSGAAGDLQISTVSMSDQQVIAGATYTLTFSGSDGEEHPVEYMATQGDSVAQVQAGLLAAMGAAQGSDDLLGGFKSSLDVDTGLLTFSNPNEFGLDAKITRDGTPWWGTQFFPATLFEIITRGGYSGALKEQGQTDKGMAEEQVVATETQLKIGQFVAPPFNALTDQATPKSRYRIS